MPFGGASRQRRREEWGEENGACTREHACYLFLVRTGHFILTLYTLPKAPDPSSSNTSYEPMEWLGALF